MTRIRFHLKLDDLKERLLVMAGMAEATAVIAKPLEQQTKRRSLSGSVVFVYASLPPPLGSRLVS